MSLIPNIYQNENCIKWRSKKSKIFYDWICIWTINQNDKLKWKFEEKK